MKIKKNAMTGSNICFIILLITTILLWIVNIVPSVDYNTLNTTDQMMYDMGVYEGETPMWKNICWVIIFLLVLLEAIIPFFMCRCNYCGRYVGYINKFKIYCPYCSNALDKTSEEIENEINSKKE